VNEPEAPAIQRPIASGFAIGRVLDLSFTILRRNPVPFISLSAAIQALASPRRTSPGIGEFAAVFDKS
jgi:hypothetical protein